MIKSLFVHRKVLGEPVFEPRTFGSQFLGMYLPTNLREYPMSFSPRNHIFESSATFVGLTTWFSQSEIVLLSNAYIVIQK